MALRSVQAKSGAHIVPVMTPLALRNAAAPAFLIVAMLMATQQLHARPDFSASEITTDTTSIKEGDVVHFKVSLRNRGDEPAEAAEVTIQWPSMGHLVEVTGLDNARIDHDAREVAAAVSLPANGERLADVAVLAPRDGGGNRLSVSVRVFHFHTMAETWVHGGVDIDTRIRSDGVRVAGLRLAPAGVLTLMWLVVTLVAVLLARMLARKGSRGRFFSPGAGIMAIMIAIGFWMIFGAMAWHDYQVLNCWKETTGTIIGRRVTLQSVSSNQRLGSGATSQTKQSNVAKPEFAVRYTVDGKEMLSAGYDTGSSLRVGGGTAQLEKEFQEWTIGAHVPCWYDPADPAGIVLKRGFGGAYIFALLPLFPFWMGWRILRGSLAKTE